MTIKTLNTNHKLVVIAINKAGKLPIIGPVIDMNGVVKVIKGKTKAVGELVIKKQTEKL